VGSHTFILENVIQRRAFRMSFPWRSSMRRSVSVVRSFRSGNASESNRRSQAYDQGIGDWLPQGRRRRRRYVTAGTQDQLQIRLQNPPWCNVCFVGDFEHRLVITDRVLDAGELNLVLV